MGGLKTTKSKAWIDNAIISPPSMIPAPALLTSSAQTSGFRSSASHNSIIACLCLDGHKVRMEQAWALDHTPWMVVHLKGMEEAMAAGRWPRRR